MMIESFNLENLKFIECSNGGVCELCEELKILGAKSNNSLIILNVGTSTFSNSVLYFLLFLFNLYDYVFKII
jgi:hypothetical protein